MNKEELNSLLPGEKAADILEYHYGLNGSKLVYEVTVYTCKKLLFTKYISTYKFPFYFSNRKLAEEYLQNIDKFEIDTLIEYDMWGDSCGSCYVIIPKNIKNLHYVHRMICSYTNKHGGHLHKGEIWDGYVDSVDVNRQSKVIYTKEHFTEIEILEQNASKEGTTGNRFSYKLQPVN